MPEREARFYDFDCYRLDTRNRLLLRDGQAVKIAPKPFGALRMLVREQGRLVTDDELLLEVWDGVIVEPGVVSTCIWTVRRILQKRPDGNEFIVRDRKGYRFAAPVRVSEEETPVRLRPERMSLFRP